MPTINLTCPQPELPQPYCEAPIIPECPACICEAPIVTCPQPVCPQISTQSIPPIKNDSSPLALSQSPAFSEIKAEQSNESLLTMLSALIACVVVNMVTTFIFSLTIMKRQAKLHEVRPPSPIPPNEYWNSAEQNSEEKTIIYESIPRPQPTIPESPTIEEPPFPRPDSPSLEATVEATDTDSVHTIDSTSSESSIS
jgi:hypothetical protein